MKEVKEEGQITQITPAPIILYWEKKNKGVQMRYFHNGETGEGSFQLNEIIEKDKSYSIVKRASRFEYGYGIQLNKNDNTLIFDCFYVDTRGIEKGSKRKWIKYTRGFDSFSVSKKKELIEIDGNKIPSHEHTYFSSSKYPHDVMGYSKVSERSFTISNSIQTFIDFFGGVCQLSANHQIRLSSIGSILSLLQYKEQQKKNSKNQLLVDKLIELTPKLDVDFDKIKTINSKKEHIAKKYSVLEKIDTDKECCVLRTFTTVKEDVNNEYFKHNAFEEYQSPYNYEKTKKKSSKEIAVEGARIYFYGKDVLCCKPNNIGDYISSPLFKNHHNWENNLIAYDSSIAKGTKLEYLTTILQEIEPQEVGYAIWAFIKEPIFEQLYKAGYKNAVKACICKNKYRFTYCSPIDNLGLIFGKTNNSSNLYNKLGLNKYQLGKINSYLDDNYDNHIGILNDLKMIITKDISRYGFFPPCNIGSIDNQTFDFLLNSIIEYGNYRDELFEDEEKQPQYIPDIVFNHFYSPGSRDYALTLSRIYQEYGLNAVKNMQKKVIELCLGDEPAAGYNPHNMYTGNAVEIYNDYLNMARLIDTNEKLPYNFDTCAQLRDMHDSLIIIYNKEKNNIEDDKFNKQLGKLKKYEFENDSYIAVSPKHASDLVIEGTQLRHCVKSYIQKVIDGHTNIMFIRRKDEPEKPFFTVEISNRGVIEQVHGFANCNADSDPLVSGFIDDWLKSKKVSTNNYNKIR